MTTYPYSHIPFHLCYYLPWRIMFDFPCHVCTFTSHMSPGLKDADDPNTRCQLSFPQHFDFSFVHDGALFLFIYSLWLGWSSGGYTKWYTQTIYTEVLRCRTDGEIFTTNFTVNRVTITPLTLNFSGFPVSQFLDLTRSPITCSYSFPFLFCRWYLMLAVGQEYCPCLLPELEPKRLLLWTNHLSSIRPWTSSGEFSDCYQNALRVNRITVMGCSHIRSFGISKSWPVQSSPLCVLQRIMGLEVCVPSSYLFICCSWLTSIEVLSGASP